jgi:uncharacterized damage-inducible protein DinB
MSLITAMPSSEREALIEENLHSLAQLRVLVAELSPEHYRQAFGAQGHHSLGKHVRHIIDHYDALLGGKASPDDGELDYEHRQRDAALEQWPQLAGRRLGEIAKRLQHEGGLSPGQGVRLAYPTGGETLSLGSSMGRELAFLTSHTVHHMAIIGLLAEQLDITLPESFGVHPSTLRHWERNAADQARA